MKTEEDKNIDLRQSLEKLKYESDLRIQKLESGLEIKTIAVDDLNHELLTANKTITNLNKAGFQIYSRLTKSDWPTLWLVNALIDQLNSLFENLFKSIESLKIEITTITTERNDLRIQYAELNNNYTILIEKVKFTLS